MADDCKRLARGLHTLYKLTSLWLHPHIISVECPSRQQNSIKIIWICLVQGHIDVDATGFHIVIHSLYRPRFGRDDLCNCSGLIKRLFWFSQLYQLEVLGCQDGNAHSMQLISLHRESLSNFSNFSLSYQIYNKTSILSNIYIISSTIFENKNLFLYRYVCKICKPLHILSRVRMASQRPPRGDLTREE